MKRIFICIFLMINVFCVNCRAIDREGLQQAAFDKYIRDAKGWDSLSMGGLLVHTAKSFLECEYVAATLEEEPEQLVVNLQTFDCTTFVETCLALAWTVKTYDRPAFEDYRQKLTVIRYRNGEIGDYTTRLHYFTDWIYDNGRLGIVRDVTEEIGGKCLDVNLFFMSEHPDSYKQLASNADFVEIIRRQEKEISGRKVYHYIPKDEITQFAQSIQDGDIVCFVTDIGGLDVSHLGFAYWDDGELTFIHASSSANKVIINPKPLKDYMEASKRCTGLIVVRANY